MAKHTLVVEFDGDGPAYAAGDTVLGWRLVAVDFGGDRLAVVDDLREALEEMFEFFQPGSWGSEGNRIDALDKARAALAKATQ